MATVAQIDPSRRKWNALAVVAGVVAGLVVSIVLTFAAFGPGEAFLQGCATAVAVTVAGFLLTAALAWAAWYTVARAQGAGVGLNLLRGLLFTVVAYTLIPWPCSIPWGGALYAFGFACSHR